IEELSDLIIVGEGAKAKLTELGQWLKDVVIGGVMQFSKVVKSAIKVIKEWSEAGLFNISVLKLYFLPLVIVIGLVDMLGPKIGKLILTLYVLHKTIAFGTIIFWLLRVALGLTTLALIKFSWSTLIATKYGKILHAKAMPIWVWWTNFLAASWWQVGAAIAGAGASFYAFYKVGEWLTSNISGIAGALAVLAVMVALVTVAYYGLAAAAAAGSITSAWGMIGTAAAVGAVGLGLGAAKGWLWKDSGEDMLGTDAMDAYMVQLEARVSSNSSLGGGATDLYVDNLYTANDDLGERAYSSSYTTTNDRQFPTSGF
ncbi:MAG: hypothetical protein QF535_15070, partial [Anaerolineales bacterium]|nr:hypothetical protein [Anaerolineales bacterium]